jgi:hypothetical protein
MPPLIEVMKNCGDATPGLCDLIFQQLGILVSILKRHTRDYLPLLIEVDTLESGEHEGEGEEGGGRKKGEGRREGREEGEEGEGREKGGRRERRGGRSGREAVGDRSHFFFDSLS